MNSVVKLKPLCKKIGSGVTPRGGDSVYIDQGVTLIRSQNVYNGKFSEQGLVFITSDMAQRMRGVTVEKNDILLNITGDSVARCCIVPEQILPARVNQHVSIVRTFQDELDPKFLMYYLISPYMQRKMLSFAGSGGTRKALTKEMIENFDIPEIDYTFQQKISTNLAAYDDIIEVNNRRIQLLEEVARLLYREWFVYFRFPGHGKIEDGVPEGWEKVPLLELIDFKEGPGLRNHQFREEGIPFLNIRTFGDDEIDLLKVGYLGETEVYGKYQHFLLKENDHVISSSGTLGRLVTVRASHLPLMLNTSLIRMRPKGLMKVWILKAYLLYGGFIEKASSLAIGAAQLNFGPAHLKKMVILFPKNIKIIDEFEKIIEPIYLTKKTLLDQNLKLAQARDLLLPRLMSGKIEV